MYVINLTIAKQENRDVSRIPHSKKAFYCIFLSHYGAVSPTNGMFP